MENEAIANAIQVGWLWLIPALPLLGSALNAFLGPWLQRAYGKRANHAIARRRWCSPASSRRSPSGRWWPRTRTERFFEDQLWTMWQSGIAAG